jgi:hypothetical protein
MLQDAKEGVPPQEKLVIQVCGGMRARASSCYRALSTTGVCACQALTIPVAKVNTAEGTALVASLSLSALLPSILIHPHPHCFCVTGIAFYHVHVRGSFNSWTYGAPLSPPFLAAIH